MIAPNIVAMLATTVEKHANRPAARDKARAANGEQHAEWRRWNYQEFSDDIQAVAQWLIEVGIQAGDKVGIFSQNRAEWSIADMAALRVGAASVPIYATNTAEQAEYIINHSDMRLLFVDTQANYDKVQEIAKNIELLHVVPFDTVTNLTNNDRQFWKILDEGKSLSQHANVINQRSAAIQADDVASLVYTSGTTGQPKGVMLSHRNILHQFHGFEADFNVNHEDRSLCFLPLSHIYERAWTYSIMYFAAENVYLDNPREIAEFLLEAKPTVMCAVPRFYEKVHSNIQNRLENSSPIQQKLITWALSVGSKYYGATFRKRVPPLGITAQHWLADKIVLQRLRDAIGGNKKFMTAGGAPLAQELEEYFLSMGILVFQGYGLTETSPVVTNNSFARLRFGTVGHTIPNIDIKIDPENGELLVRGPLVMQGYYKNPEATAEVMDGDWFRTGDVAEIDDDGFVRITDRIKHLIITAGGKNVAPQPIELALTQNSYVESVVCVGDRKPYITALIVPDMEKLEEFAQKNNLSGDINDWVEHESVQALYQGLVDAACEHRGRVERIKKFTLLRHPFSIETGEFTPKLSIKRKVVMTKYAAEIEKMYEGH